MRGDELAEVRDATLSLLTYNVAGLPSFLSASDPVENMPLISRLLDNYDLALVQEDFAYHDTLASQAHHRRHSLPAPVGSAGPLGDGLNRFSTTAFDGFERHAWTDCYGSLSNGSDCLTGKGFSVGTHRLARGAEVDVYNVHMDSGTAPGDRDARASQVEQLLGTLRHRSPSRAVIIAGDFNMGTYDEALARQLLDRGGLSDACTAVACDNPHNIDRVMYRDSDMLHLEVLRVSIDRRFVRDDGQRLSDHEPVGIMLRWRLRRPAAPGGPDATTTLKLE